MELLWNELPGENMIYSGLSQAAIEGKLPLPEGRAVKELLSSTGLARITSAAAGDGEVAVEGTVSVDLICMDEGVFAFTSQAGFRHTIAAEGVSGGMNVNVFCALQSLEITRGEEGLALSAVVDLNAMVTASGGVKTLAGIAGVDDAEELCEELELFSPAAGSRGTFRLREEIEASFAAAVLYSEARAAVMEVSPARDGTLLEGALCISALVESKNGALSQLSRTIPFSRTVEGSGAWAEVSVTAWDLRAAEDFGVVIAEAQLGYTLLDSTCAKARAVLDVFSPTAPFECTRAPIRPCSFMGCLNRRHSLNESVAIPPDMPEAQRPVYCGVRAFVTSQGIENGVLTAEGLLFVSILYAGEDGGLSSFGEDVPFRVETEARDATDAQVLVWAAASASGSGRQLEISCTLLLSARLYAVRQLQAVTGIEECPPPQTPDGLIVYFASPGETLYSIARRYNTGRANLRMLCPELPEVLQGGERVAFLK